MQYPDYYNKVQTIPMHDALSDFLGAFEEGHVSFTYLDCVKYAGHSCPTVAGAYLMTLLGLQNLYPDTLPQRGEIHVSMKSPKEEGVTGVMCNIISFIVGASDQSGFKGIAGNFSRVDLIHYNTPMSGEVTLTRVDTKQSVSLSYDPSTIKADTQMKTLMQKCMQNLKTQNIEIKKEQQTFATLWQKRVENILLSTHLWDTMITKISH